VPLKQGDRTRGLIGLGNRPGGYRPEDLEAAERLCIADPEDVGGGLGELPETLLALAQAQLRPLAAQGVPVAEASSDVLWIRDAETFEMEFVSPALRTVYGIEPNVLGPEMLRRACQIAGASASAASRSSGR
jgi:hypothetical protein